LGRSVECHTKPSSGRSALLRARRRARLPPLRVGQTAAVAAVEEEEEEEEEKEEGEEEEEANEEGMFAASVAYHQQATCPRGQMGRRHGQEAPLRATSATAFFGPGYYGPLRVASTATTAASSAANPGAGGGVGGRRKKKKIANAREQWQQPQGEPSASAPQANGNGTNAISTAAATTAAAAATTADDAAAFNAARANANASNAPCSSVVLDGANLAWTYSASLYSKLGCRTRLPLSRGVTLAMECPAWERMGVTPVAFMPQTYIEGPLHGLADGGSLDTLVPGNVAYIGGSTWRNTVLWDLREAGRLVAVERPIGARDADDRKIIEFARERNAMICSNDHYEDHIAGAGSDKGGLRRWLDANRTGYDFCVGTPEEAAYAQRKTSRVERPPVGCGHLPPPPSEENPGKGEEKETGDEDSGQGTGRLAWRRELHALGSSRPWALGVNRWGKEGKGSKGSKRRRGTTLGNKGGFSARRGKSEYSSASESEAEDEFPFWALADVDLPVVFRVKKEKME